MSEGITFTHGTAVYDLPKSIWRKRMLGNYRNRGKLSREVKTLLKGWQRKGVRYGK